MIRFCLDYIFEDQEVDERFLHKFEVISILRVSGLIFYFKGGVRGTLIQ